MIMVSNQTFKRNQFLEAASMVMEQGPNPSVALKTDTRRLLDTDRGLGFESGVHATGPRTYAFFSDEPPGRGVEVQFTSYEAFALRLGLSLLQHDWPQATAVNLLRTARPSLEPTHSKILKWDPKEVLKPTTDKKTKKRVMGTIRPIFLVISSDADTKRHREDPNHQAAKLSIVEQSQVMAFLLRNPTTAAATTVELSKMALELDLALARTKPSKRGRGSS